MRARPGRAGSCLGAHQHRWEVIGYRLVGQLDDTVGEVTVQAGGLEAATTYTAEEAEKVCRVKAVSGDCLCMR